MLLYDVSQVKLGVLHVTFMGVARCLFLITLLIKECASAFSLTDFISLLIYPFSTFRPKGARVT
jgi:hypothetical protein